MLFRHLRTFLVKSRRTSFDLTFVLSKKMFSFSKGTAKAATACASKPESEEPPTKRVIFVVVRENAKLREELPKFLSAHVYKEDEFDALFGDHKKLTCPLFDFPSPFSFSRMPAKSVFFDWTNLHYPKRDYVDLELEMRVFNHISKNFEVFFKFNS